ncbi:hypothetical protein K431DRAFT_315288 [Polychaeton citri CBS 116435]|uniref:Uncharacterized protein n=1 Tax=Polychaeton citri CBS 116435 TaxID=1314669 RepID=A0A9P4UJI6_9PEZI|nr:hypothetical protein K431DRAFT_315288 [Polychaeton citri CBS 116435]
MLFSFCPYAVIALVVTQVASTNYGRTDRLTRFWRLQSDAPPPPPPPRLPTNEQESHPIEPANFFSQRTKEVLSILQNVQKLPTCNKNAAKALIHDCQSLETDPLEQIKAVYAARLAVCELLEAKANIPPACSSFLPKISSSSKQYMRGWLRPGSLTKPTIYDARYEQATEEDLISCLAQLRREPQSWTSYSNNRQNAVVMCRAARAEIEQDENINLFKSFTEATYRQMSDLFETREYYEAVKKDFHELSTKIQDFHIQLYENHEDIKTKIQLS